MDKNVGYFTLIKIGMCDDTLKLWCNWGGAMFTDYFLENGDLGYDFFDNFKKNYALVNEDTNIEQDKLLDTYIYLIQKIEKWKKAKRQSDMRQVPSILCNICKHRINHNTCKAFSDGIPIDLQNEPHHKKHPSQKNDIVFEIGEEGSKNAEIKPIKKTRVNHCSLTEEFLFGDFAKIMKGEKEELYVDYR